jgi:hydroxymethylbilane synthase
MVSFCYTRMKIGTRCSKLAIRQVDIFIDDIKRYHPDLLFEISKIKTQGDQMQDIFSMNYNKGIKGLFTSTLDDALINGDIDVAVHSLKDVPSILDDNIQISAFLKRESALDVLISKNKIDLNDKNIKIAVATSSDRRSCFMKYYYPNIEIIPIRGNIDTRLEKLKNSHIDAIIIARAGVERLGIDFQFENLFTQDISYDILPPAIGQGTISIHTLKDNNRVNDIVKSVSNMDAEFASKAERLFAHYFEAKCGMPISCYATIHDNDINISASFIVKDEMRLVSGSRFGSAQNIDIMARDLSYEIRGKI